MVSVKKTSELVAKKISQPNAFNYNKKLEKQDDDVIFHRKSGFLSYDCSYWGGTSKKSFCAWSHPENILEKKSAQCGTTEKRYGSNNEVRHIGSPTGDIPRPAMLHLYDFKKSFINSSSKIYSITVSFKYRVVNVNDKGSPQTKNLLASELAVIQGFQAWFGTWKKGTLFSEVIKDNTKLKYEGQNKKGYIWKEISFTFKDVDASDILNSNFAFNLQFGMNCSKASTPCFLYIDNLKINVTYESSNKYIEGTNNTNSLYTSTDTGCYTTITQTIEAGYKKGKTKIPTSQAPEKLGKKIKICSKPNGVTVQQNGTATDLNASFTVIDQTNVAGEKTVTYCLQGDESTKVKMKYTAMLRPKPSYSIMEKYKHQEDFDPNKSYIIFKNGCASSIKIYIDSINNQPLTLSVANQNSTVNLLNQSQVQAFHNQIKALPCGYHTLYIQRGNESIEDTKKNTFTIQVLPMEYKFKIFSEENLALIYNQSKKDTPSRPRYAYIKIQRIDDEPRAIIPSVKITDETNLTNETILWSEVAKGDVYENNGQNYKIDLYYPGDFYVKIAENNSVCSSSTPSFAKITVEGDHKQNYDYLFTQGQDGTTFDFDYLVAWEGDNVKTPIKASEIGLHHSIDDIRICSNSSEIGLSQIGLIELKVTNKTNDEHFQNVKIELNTLIKDDNNQFDVTTDEWVSEDGIFKNFYQLFYEYNITDNVTVENLTPDNDLVDEENVYLHIKDISAGDTVTIYLPYRSTVEKTVYLQYLLFEQPQEIYSISNCDTTMENPPTYIDISVTDSMQTQLSISGNTDLLNIDTHYECPQECYSTINPGEGKESGGITYTITNVDTNDFSDQYVRTDIINSNEMEPYGYYLNNQYYEFFKPNGDLNDELDPNQQIKWTQEKELVYKNLIHQYIYAYIKFPHNEQQIITQRTNEKGVATFLIPIPPESDRSYTIKELLTDILYFHYKGNSTFNPSIKAEENNPYAIITSPYANKSYTMLEYKNNYRRYKPGQIAEIPVSLTGILEIIRNKIIFNAQLHDSGSSDSVTILYRICNLKNNEGVFNTTFRTNSKLLIPQEISKKVYCGIDTSVNVHIKLNKKVIEQKHLNVLYITAQNQGKINKNVYIDINLGQNLSQGFSGDYKFVDINIDIGDYSISEDENGNMTLRWLLGEMQEYQKNKAIIKIQANKIGLSDIQINTFDYLHTDSGAISIKQNQCPKCDEETTYTIKNSPWKEFDNVWYKLINGEYYKPTLVNKEVKWVKKNG